MEAEKVRELSLRLARADDQDKWTAAISAAIDMGQSVDEAMDTADKVCEIEIPKEQ